ncbi:glycosyltransferase family 1 protein [Brachybacterium phenoliresistens]|uniref:glycosyltransferase family 1 protein n=1 Tax=Brachybacterium phenoliresistens TaxID=396014 RepID=UPI0031CF9C3C
MARLDVLYIRAGGTGWGPVDELAHLTARLLDGTLTTIDDRGEVSMLRKAAASVPSPRRGDRVLLVLAASPAHLAYAARREQWFPGYRTTVAWVIDSFWSDRISRFARRRGHFDHIAITDPDLLEEWSSATGADVHLLPWGADTLAAGAIPPDRPVDLVRIGRQPPAWDDDDRTIAMAREYGLVVEGRPSFHADVRENQSAVRHALKRAKFALAFSNLVSPAPYTHPTREYITGRWTDSLAAGTTVAGVAPSAAATTLWPRATVTLDPSDLRTGLEQLRRQVDDWTPAIAAEQNRAARLRLDWRWRLKVITSLLDVDESPALRAELEQLGSSEENA